jgi:hypothetical protein
MLSAKQEELMASEWIKLTGLTDEAEKLEIYVNLTNARSIWPKDGGSEIWFRAGAGKDGTIRVKESPKKIFRILRKVPNAAWT